MVTLLGGALATAADEAAAARVVIVANTADPDSLPLAEYYARARNIPLANIVALPLPTAETLTWPDFSAQVFGPLRRELVARGWIDAEISSQNDEYGRPRIRSRGHRISYLVPMRGVPLRIQHNPAWIPATLPPGVPPNLLTNQASVDGELALLAVPDVPVIAAVDNPLFKTTEPVTAMARAVVRVVRLDGPTPEAVRGMIDGALAAERDGLVGRAYVDFSGFNPMGDEWLEKIVHALEPTGYDLSVDRAKATFGPLARFDAPALYFGWYAWDVDGPFLVPGFRFAPGAIAVHIHSFSAETLRNANGKWCGPLVARGAAATLGNVFEPFLGLTHHLDLFCDALIQGHSFGEAAYCALPALSWEDVAIGDPLYRPFAKSVEVQWADRAKLPAALQPYLAVRQARLALRAGRKDEALQIVRHVFLEQPSVTAGLDVARLAAEAGGPAAAVPELTFLGMLHRYEPRDVGPVRDAAALLIEGGAVEAALQLYRKLLEHPPAGDAEVALLEEAIQAAAKANLSARADGWRSRLLVLRPPPPPPAAGKEAATPAAAH